MANEWYGFTSLTGGGSGALDAIDGAALADGEMALGVVSGIAYVYQLDSDRAGAESSPRVVKPDTNADDKRWILVSVRNDSKVQPAPTAKTTATTLTIAELLTKIITGTHTAGSTQAYTLPTGTLTDAGLTIGADECFDWTLINLSAAVADTITLTAGVAHTIVGNPIVQSANAATGGLYGNSATFRTRKTATNTFVTYRIS